MYLITTSECCTFYFRTRCFRRVPVPPYWLRIYLNLIRINGIYPRSFELLPLARRDHASIVYNAKIYRLPLVYAGFLDFSAKISFGIGSPAVFFCMLINSVSPFRRHVSVRCVANNKSIFPIEHQGHLNYTICKKKCSLGEEKQNFESFPIN